MGNHLISLSAARASVSAVALTAPSMISREVAGTVRNRFPPPGDRQPIAIASRDAERFLDYG